MLLMSALERLWASAIGRNDYDAAWNISASILAQRDPGTRDDPALPYHRRWVWDGTSLRRRHVLVRCYNGLGDTIQFVRYLSFLRRIAASVTLEAQPALLPLLNTLRGADCFIPFDPATPATQCDCAIEIMELFFALRLRPEQAAPPYLCAVPASLPSGTLGLCWQAGDWDPQRSIAPYLFQPLTRWPCVSLVTAPTDLAVLNPQGCPKDMVRTAALVAGARLIVTVDTMIAHLAGALGRPVWLLLKHDPDWRWSSGGAHSPWYPSMRIYRQSAPGDWGGVVARVLADLPATLRNI
jgi:hypothetical protein